MTYINRPLIKKIETALKVSPIVFINGPRQVGKSTLAQKIGEQKFPVSYVTFDNATQLAAATAYPLEFLKGRQEGFLILDEVQLVPDLFRALKIVIDEARLQGQNINGRYLLTGSANILALPKLSEALVGRMSVSTLYPLAAFEVVDGQGNFIERIFNQDFHGMRSSSLSLLEVIWQSTFPEISHKSKEERGIWFEGYLTSIIQRDIRALFELDKIALLPNLLKVLAFRVGNLLNDADIARDLGLNPVTEKHYRKVLEMMFLTFEIMPWFRNIGKRLVKASKGYIMDTSFLCAVLNYDLETLQFQNPSFFGHVLENFVVSELKKLASYEKEKVSILHFRKSDGKEIDILLEKEDRTLVAIEIKSREHIDERDFKAIRELQEEIGKDFVTGIVLYRGKEVVPFGKDMWALPLHFLWN
ncbi:MAG: ATP-binding protein [Proteobacteria bacterium]|nr:ATP-binding protein [Pseudomonadota bacterium]